MVLVCDDCGAELGELGTVNYRCEPELADASAGALPGEASGPIPHAA